MEFIQSIGNYLGSSLQFAFFNVLKAAAIFVIGWWVVTSICKIVLLSCQKSFKDVGVASLLESILKFSLRIILLVAVLQCFGFDITAIVAAIGASLFAVGISLKDSIANLASGIILVVSKPIHVGDYIECDKSAGTVVKIEMMFTFLQSPEENQVVVIPNSKLISSSINRVSEYNMVRIECERKIPFIPKMSDLKKYVEKEFLLNKNIFTVPVPEVKLQGVEDGISTIVLSVWCQRNKAASVNESLEAMAEKFEAKHSNKKK